MTNRRRRGIIKNFFAEEIVRREEVEIFFRQNFVADFVEVSFNAKNFFEVVGRVEGVGKIDGRNEFRLEAAHVKKNDVAGRGRHVVEVVKNILVSAGVALAFVFHAVRQIFFVQKFLEITCNRFVEGSGDAVIVTRADEKNSVQKFFGLSGSLAFAVFYSQQRIITVGHEGRAVEIRFYFRRAQKMKNLFVRVAEFVERRLNFSAFVVANNFSQRANAFESFVKICAAFVSADGGILRQK